MHDLGHVEGGAISDPPAGFDEFVAGSAPGLLRFAYLLTGDGALAEDIVQQALIKAHRVWGGDVRAEQPVAYVRRAIVNEFTSWRRRRWSTEVTGSVPDRGQTDTVDELAQRDLVWRALADLPRRQRAVLVMRYYEAMPDAAIALVLHCAQGTVRSLAARAFEALRRHPGLTDDAAHVQVPRKEKP